MARPAGFAPHPKLERTLQARRAALEEEGAVNWAHAESLAFASLLADGIAIRLSGQDSERGTFSQRHLVLHDIGSGARFMPLHALPQARASFAVYNSPLSENAALGFEYGYSGQAPDTLVLWEAQYRRFRQCCPGDHRPVHQRRARQVAAAALAGAAAAAWLRRARGRSIPAPAWSATCSLPATIICAWPTDHRRPVFPSAAPPGGAAQAGPTPLIVMAPKSLLRHPLCRLAARGVYRRRLPAGDRRRPRPAASRPVTRLILCSGKVYVDLMGDGCARKPNALPSSAWSSSTPSRTPS